jgi:chorismate--pyruvate lyase
MPHWTPRFLSNPRLSRALFAWLGVGGSLSAHLARAFGALTVAKSYQGRGRLRADEMAQFPRVRGHAVHVRDVVLHCDGQPVVMAHSVTAQHSLRGPWRGLLGLGSRPLAELLFHDRRVKRLPLQMSRVSVRSALGRRWERQWRERTGQSNWAAPGCAQLWARRSVFLRHGHPLLVTEIFDARVAKFAPSTHGKPQAQWANRPRSQR